MPRPCRPMQLQLLVCRRFDSEVTFVSAADLSVIQLFEVRKDPWEAWGVRYVRAALPGQYTAEVIQVGSLRKGTALRGHFDHDLLLKIDVPSHGDLFECYSELCENLCEAHCVKSVGSHPGHFMLCCLYCDPNGIHKFDIILAPLSWVRAVEKF